MLDELFMQVLDMSKAASVVAVCVILARLLLRKAPKVYSYVLWALVLFRLLCPVTIELPVSVMPELQPVSQTYSLAEETVTFQNAGTVVSQAVEGQKPVYTRPETGEEPVQIPLQWQDVAILCGQYLWVAGMGIMALYSLISYLLLHRRLQTAAHVEKNIYVTESIQSPFVIGLFRPKIYLPDRLNPRQQQAILLHEQYHIRHLDPIVKPVAFLALTIHWFNPLMWLCFRLACRDMEMRCDEAVVRKMGQDSRADYAALLLSLATGRQIIAGTPLAFGEGNTGRRIRNLASWRKPGFWVVSLSVAVCIVLAVCLLTNPQSAEAPLDTLKQLRTDAIDYAQVRVKIDEEFYFMLSDSEIQELTECLNGLRKKDFSPENRTAATWTKYLITSRRLGGLSPWGLSKCAVVLSSEQQIIVLQYDGKTVAVTVCPDSKNAVAAVSWITENEELCLLMKQIGENGKASGLAVWELQKIHEALIPYMLEYKIATLDAEETTGLLAVELYEQVDGLEELVSQFIDLRYVRISMLEGEVRVTGDGGTSRQVQLEKEQTGSSESSYRVRARLMQTDLSKVWRHTLVNAQLEQYQQMTEMERLASSKLWDIVYIPADSWSECETEIGIQIANPLEKASWLTYADSNGIPFENGLFLESRHHVQIAAHLTKYIVVDAGYLDGDVRVAFCATLLAETGEYTTGRIWQTNTTFQRRSEQTGGGIPVMVLIPDAPGSYENLSAYWQTEQVLYCVSLAGQEQNALEATLDRLLAEF